MSDVEANSDPAEENVHDVVDVEAALPELHDSKPLEVSEADWVESDPERTVGLDDED